MCLKRLSSFLFLFLMVNTINAQDIDLSDLSELADDIEEVVVDELGIENSHVTGVSADRKVYKNEDFDGVDWSDQNMSGVTFNAVNFYSSDLSGVDFSYAVFLNTDFTNTKVEGACFYGAKLTNTDFDSTSSVRNSNFSNSSRVNSDIDGDTLGVVWGEKKCGSDVAIGQVVKSNLVRAELIKADDIIQALAEGDDEGMNFTINFKTDSDELLGKAHVQVYEIAQALKSAAMKGNQFMIQGHTDSDGAIDYNIDLSYRRALQVSRKLSEEYGVLASTLSVDGLGESQPLTSNDDAAGKAINRRVTLINMGKM